MATERTDYFGPAENAVALAIHPKEEFGPLMMQQAQVYATLALVQAVKQLTGVLEDRLRR